MSARSFWRYALFAAGLVGLLNLFHTRGPKVGSAAQDFDLPLVAVDDEGHRTFSLTEYSGKPLLIEVFASWCGVCRRSAPTLARAHDRHGDVLAFVGVSVDDDFAAAERMKRDWTIPYPVAHDADGSFARAYQINVLPTFILVDAAGQIREVSTGAPSEDELDEWAELATR